MATEFGVSAAREIDCELAGDTAVGAVERYVDRPGVRTHRVARYPQQNALRTHHLGPALLARSDGILPQGHN
jgi:hypothetical protein